MDKVVFKLTIYANTLYYNGYKFLNWFKYVI